LDASQKRKLFLLTRLVTLRYECVQGCKDKVHILIKFGAGKRWLISFTLRSL